MVHRRAIPAAQIRRGLVSPALPPAALDVSLRLAPDYADRLAAELTPACAGVVDVPLAAQSGAEATTVSVPGGALNVQVAMSCSVVATKAQRLDAREAGLEAEPFAWFAVTPLSDRGLLPLVAPAGASTLLKLQLQIGAPGASSNGASSAPLGLATSVARLAVSLSLRVGLGWDTAAGLDGGALVSALGNVTCTARAAVLVPNSCPRRQGAASSAATPPGRAQFAYIPTRFPLPSDLLVHLVSPLGANEGLRLRSIWSSLVFDAALPVRTNTTATFGSRAANRTAAPATYFGKMSRPIVVQPAIAAWSLPRALAVAYANASRLARADAGPNAATMPFRAVARSQSNLTLLLPPRSVGQVTAPLAGASASVLTLSVGDQVCLVSNIETIPSYNASEPWQAGVFVTARLGPAHDALDASVALPLRISHGPAGVAQLATFLKTLLVEEESSASFAAAVALAASGSSLPVELGCPPFCPGGLGYLGAPVAVVAADSAGTAAAQQSPFYSAYDLQVSLLPEAYAQLQPPLQRAAAASLQVIQLEAGHGLTLSTSCVAAGFLDPLVSDCSNPVAPETRLCPHVPPNSTDCQLCPEGVLCPAESVVRALPGHWWDVQNDRAIVCEYPFSDRCPGYTPEQGSSACGVGYVQGVPGCLLCADGYYTDTTTAACLPCPVMLQSILDWRAVRPFIIFGTVSLTALGFIIGLVVRATSRLGVPKSLAAVAAVRFVAMHLAIFLNISQTATNLQRFASLPPELRAFLSMFRALQLEDIGLIPSECMKAYTSSPFLWRILLFVGLSTLALLALMLVLLGQQRNGLHLSRFAAAALGLRIPPPSPDEAAKAAVAAARAAEERLELGKMVRQFMSRKVVTVSSLRRMGSSRDNGKQSRRTLKVAARRCCGDFLQTLGQKRTLWAAIIQLVLILLVLTFSYVASNAFGVLYCVNVKMTPEQHAALLSRALGEETVLSSLASAVSTAAASPKEALLAALSLVSARGGLSESASSSSTDLVEVAVLARTPNVLCGVGYQVAARDAALLAIIVLLCGLPLVSLAWVVGLRRLRRQAMQAAAPAPTPAATTTPASLLDAPSSGAAAPAALSSKPSEEQTSKPRRAHHYVRLAKRLVRALPFGSRLLLVLTCGGNSKARRAALRARLAAEDAAAAKATHYEMFCRLFSHNSYLPWTLYFVQLDLLQKLGQGLIRTVASEGTARPVATMALTGGIGIAYLVVRPLRPHQFGNNVMFVLSAFITCCVTGLDLLAPALPADDGAPPPPASVRVRQLGAVIIVLLLALLGVSIYAFVAEVRELMYSEALTVRKPTAAWMARMAASVSGSTRGKSLVAAAAPSPASHTGSESLATHSNPLANLPRAMALQRAGNGRDKGSPTLPGRAASRSLLRQESTSQKAAAGHSPSSKAGATPHSKPPSLHRLPSGGRVVAPQASTRQVFAPQHAK